MVVSVFPFRGGPVLAELEPSRLSWSLTLDKPDQVDLTLGLGTDEDLVNTLTEWKHCVSVEIGTLCVGGPVVPSEADADKREGRVGVRGIRAAMALTPVLPVAALTQPLAPGGVPDVSLDSAWSGLDYGTIGKRIVQQVMTWPGWSDVPIFFHADRLGTREQKYPAVDRMDLDQALTNLSKLEHGPDIRLRLRRFGEGFAWDYLSGTEDQPRLQGVDVYAWDLDDTSSLTVKRDPTRMGSIAWSEGGRSADKTLIEMAYDPYLVDNGFPLLHIESDASSTTVLPETLRQWNAETLRTARKPWEFWSFKVRADMSPVPGEYTVGDLCTIHVTDRTPVMGGYVPLGEHTRRIVGLSGDEQEDWITITTGEYYGEA